MRYMCYVVVVGGEIVPSTRSRGPKGRPAPRYASQYPVERTEGEASSQIYWSVSGREDRRGRSGTQICLTIYVCYVIVWYVVCWGNSLSFVLTVFSFGFRYLFFEGEGAGAVAVHHTHACIPHHEIFLGICTLTLLCFIKMFSRHALSFVK